MCLSFISSFCTDLDAVDEEGDTALHTAVRHKQNDVITTLLQAGADHSILNLQQMAPLHLACDLGHVEAVSALVDDPCVDLNLPGELGSKPLHYCCIRDHHECAKLLVSNIQIVIGESIQTLTCSLICE